MDFMLNKYLYLFNCFAVYVFKTFVYFINIYIRANATDTLIACLAKNTSTDVNFFLSFHKAIQYSMITIMNLLCI